MDGADVIDVTNEMKGTFDILFVGEDGTHRLVIDGCVRDTYARIRYLYSPDGTIYNFSNIISFKKIH